MSGAVWAQSLSSSFQQAQQAVAQQQYTAAENYCRQIIKQEPQHWDAHLLLAYIHGWQGNFDQAEILIQHMLTALPSQDSAVQQVIHEAMLCHTRLAYWQGDLEETIRRAEEGIALFPDETEFLMLAGKVAMANQAYLTALELFDRVLLQDPDHQEAQALRDDAYWLSAKYQAGVLYGHEIYSHSPYSRQTLSAELTRFWKKIALTGRMNRSYRFDLVSHQMELEGWITLSSRWYLYAHTGYSDAILFPRFRSGLEPFYKLTPSLEISAGYRSLHYTDQTIWIYTASLYKYLGKGSLGLRTYWSPTTVGWRKSIEASGRLYLPDEYNFVELKVGSGASPDNAYLDATYQQIWNSTSVYTVLGAQKRFPRRWLGKVWGVFDYQMPNPGNNFSITSLNVGLWKRF